MEINVSPELLNSLRVAVSALDAQWLHLSDEFMRRKSAYDFDSELSKKNTDMLEKDVQEKRIASVRMHIFYDEVCRDFGLFFEEGENK